MMNILESFSTDMPKSVSREQSRNNEGTENLSSQPVVLGGNEKVDVLADSDDEVHTHAQKAGHKSVVVVGHDEGQGVAGR